MDLPPAVFWPEMPYSWTNMQHVVCDGNMFCTDVREFVTYLRFQRFFGRVYYTDIPSQLRGSAAAWWDGLARV